MTFFCQSQGGDPLVKVYHFMDELMKKKKGKEKKEKEKKEKKKKEEGKSKKGLKKKTTTTRVERSECGCKEYKGAGAPLFCCAALVTMHQTMHLRS